MKALTSFIFLILLSEALYAQDLTGRWEGNLLMQNTTLRIVFHVEKAKDQYTVSIDSPDQNASGIKATVANFSYPNMKFEVLSIGATYEGTLSGNNITGKWIQSGTALYLALARSEASPVGDK